MSGLHVWTAMIYPYRLDSRNNSNTWNRHSDRMHTLQAAVRPGYQKICLYTMRMASIYLDSMGKKNHFHAANLTECHDTKLFWE